VLAQEPLQPLASLRAPLASLLAPVPALLETFAPFTAEEALEALLPAFHPFRAPLAARARTVAALAALAALVETEVALESLLPVPAAQSLALARGRAGAFLGVGRSTERGAGDEEEGKESSLHGHFLPVRVPWSALETARRAAGSARDPPSRAERSARLLAFPGPRPGAILLALPPFPGT
jgi:hypothetical protein